MATQFSEELALAIAISLSSGEAREGDGDGAVRAASDQAAIDLGTCRSVNDFEKLNLVEEGEHGETYRARDKRDGRVVALKRMRTEQGDDGLSVSSLREIHLLLGLRHENIVRLREVVVGHNLHQTFLVTDCEDKSLASLLDNMAAPFAEAQVKCITTQLLTALAFIHAKHIVHRDLKVSNLHITDEGVVKLGDFGLTRGLSEDEASLWHRAPELLLGASEQGPAVDVWAAGCVLGGLLLHRPLLPGKSELDQLRKIVQLLGSPSETIWPGLSRLPLLASFPRPEQPRKTLESLFPKLPSSSLALLQGCFTYSPVERWSAQDCLGSVYWKELPLAAQLDVGTPEASKGGLDEAMAAAAASLASLDWAAEVAEAAKDRAQPPSKGQRRLLLSGPAVPQTEAQLRALLPPDSAAALLSLTFSPGNPTKATLLFPSGQKAKRCLIYLQKRRSPFTVHLPKL